MIGRNGAFPSVADLVEEIVHEMSVTVRDKLRRRLWNSTIARGNRSILLQSSDESI